MQIRNATTYSSQNCCERRATESVAPGSGAPPCARLGRSRLFSTAIAAGNASTDNDRRPHYPSSYDIGNVISVAALDRNDQLASFSNWGAKHVAIAAPGAEILSTWLGDDYEEKSGTSMATPFVAGVAALIAANEPRISVDELRKRVVTSVVKLDSLKSKVASGGRINAAKALGAQ